jgi:GR25 family glycosyltransferase involved in LPS biosynthesis
MAGRSSRRRVRKTRRIKRRLQRGGSVPTSPLFEHAYAITLDENSRRYQKMKGLATAAHVPLQPWKGIKITAEERDKLPELGIGTTNYKDRTGATFNLGVIGAYLSHRNLLEHIVKNPGSKPGTLIFEDDVDIPADFYQKLAAAEPEIPTDWDFIFIDKFKEKGKMISKSIMKLEKDMTGMLNWGIWAFIVRNDSIKSKILPLMEHMIDVPDIQLAKHADKLNMYLLRPSIVSLDGETAVQSVVTVLDKAAAGKV